ncbi:hypothetical protein OG21DRAFT_1482492 [Imleria badia]|nr:hypothetical protein OG21DRAFT_1482492 [Imleria badia]
MLPSVPPDAGGHDDGTKLRRPVHSPSPEYDPAIERDEAEGIENRTVLSSQRYRAHDSHTVLNKGRCFITNRPTPVQSCHLVSQAIVRATLTKLEYVWEIGHGQFDLDTKHNVLHLRADWLTLFDDLRWILLPDVKIVEELKKIYLSDERPTSNLGKAFQYYIVPAPSLRELICRFPDVDGHEHKTYAPRFSELGPLIGHIHPHHVIFNTGHKLLNRLERIEVIQMRRLLSQNLSITVEDAKSVLDSIEDLYTQWTKTKVPAKWYKSYAPSDGQDSSSFTDDSVVVDDDDTAWMYP